MQSKWSIAATGGFLLALLTVVITLIQTVFTPPVAINLILWVIKFVGSIWLLYYFIKEYSKDKESFTYKNGFRYGVLVAFFSSFICAAYMFIHYALLFPETVAQQLDMAREMMASTSPESVDAIDLVEGILPQLIFVFSLIYYTIIGVIASAIIATYTKKEKLFIDDDN